MKDLQQLRNEIDLIDNKLIKLLHERMELVKLVGQFKKAHQLQVVDMNRWQTVLNGKIEIAEKLGLDANLVKEIYNLIHHSAISSEENQ